MAYPWAKCCVRASLYRGQNCRTLGPCCFTSTEARLLIRDGDGRWGGGGEVEVGERVKARLVHCAIAVLTAVLGQSHKDNVRCTAVEEQPEAKEVQLSQPSSTSLLMISSGLT